MGSNAMSEVENILDPVIPMPDNVEPGLTDILPRKYLSVSQISTVLKCPHSWYLRYVEEKPTTTSARMFQGIQVHKAVETVMNVKVATGELPPMSLALDTFSDAFEQQKTLIEDWEGEDPGQVKDVGVSCTKIHYQEAAPTAMPIMVEKTFHTTIKTPDGKIKLPVLGRIDQISVQAASEKEYQDIREKAIADIAAQVKKGNQNPAVPTLKKPARIGDLKVVTDKWSEADLQNDIQFALYAGVEHIPDVEVNQLVKGRAKVPRPRYELLTGVITNAQVQHTLRVTAGVAKTIGSGHLEGNYTDPGNWWCSEKWCSMWRHCRGKNK